MNLYDLEGKPIRPTPACQFIWPKLCPHSRCELLLLVTRDFSRVFVGGGEFGYDGFAREADAVEVEALVERFNIPELHTVLERRKAPLA